jgi:GNAT superfamily N-acetyltransferase
VNTFSENGAVLLGVYAGDQLVGIGGVHPDPYLGKAAIGRIRHVYVLPSHRRGGVGAELVRALIERSSDTFKTFTLRTMTEHGRAFYVAIGFTESPRIDHATHWLVVRDAV